MVRFDRYLKTVLAGAGDEARLDGSATVEAHHLLLVIAGDAGTAAARALVAAGLDRDRVRAALDREFEQSLAAVGVSASAFGVPPATPDPHRQPHPGASIQLALERAARAAGGAELQPAHLLVGILRADAGPVPRALALAGVDRVGLIDRIEQSLTRPASARDARRSG